MSMSSQQPQTTSSPDEYEQTADELWETIKEFAPWMTREEFDRRHNLAEAKKLN